VSCVAVEKANPSDGMGFPSPSLHWRPRKQSTVDPLLPELCLLFGERDDPQGQIQGNHHLPHVASALEPARGDHDRLPCVDPSKRMNATASGSSPHPRKAHSGDHPCG